ncbi:MAG: hypothetical protein GY854_03175 [Deltaproteobacteria bacterium]|nr:hypothetical protein [Deltaproteobacteria bacterium]
MRTVKVLAFASILLAASVTQAGKVTGKVIITPEFREAADKATRVSKDKKPAFYWNEPNGIADVRPLRIDPSRDLAVVLIKEGAKEPDVDELTTVKVFAGAMERSVVVTRPKSTIRFRNVNPFDHKLFVPGMDAFRPEHQSNGAFRPIEFAEEGIFEINCKLFPHFKAFVVVTKATIVVPIKKDGTFALDSLGEGSYTLKVFYNGKWIHKQNFKVAGGGGQALEVKLTPGSSGKQEAETKKKDKKAKDGAK